MGGGSISRAKADDFRYPPLRMFMAPSFRFLIVVILANIWSFLVSHFISVTSHLQPLNEKLSLHGKRNLKKISILCFLQLLKFEENIYFWLWHALCHEGGRGLKNLKRDLGYFYNPVLSAGGYNCLWYFSLNHLKKTRQSRICKDLQDPSGKTRI